MPPPPTPTLPTPPNPQVRDLGTELQDKESKLQDATYQLRQQIIQFESLKATHENSGEARERMRYEWQLTLEGVQREQVALRSRTEELEGLIRAKDEANARLARELEVATQTCKDKVAEGRIYELKVTQVVGELKGRLDRETTKLGLMREKCAQLCIQVEGFGDRDRQWAEERASLKAELKEARAEIMRCEELIRQKEDETECVREELAPLIAEHAEAVQRVQEDAERRVEEARSAQDQLVTQLKTARDENEHLTVEMRKRTSILEAIDSRLDYLSDSKREEGLGAYAFVEDPVGGGS